jgi:hypothetical protein
MTTVVEFMTSTPVVKLRTVPPLIDTPVRPITVIPTPLPEPEMV